MKKRVRGPNLGVLRGELYSKWIEPSWLDEKWQRIRQGTNYKWETGSTMNVAIPLIDSGINDEACD